jgi:hypothetical protein
VVAATVSAPDLETAAALFAGLPLDVLPAPSALPAGSWMPVRRNDLFVGRAADLLVLARLPPQESDISRFGNPLRHPTRRLTQRLWLFGLTSRN